MPPPSLLIVDEHQDDLASVEAQLVQRYGADYRVEGLSDPEQALQTLAKLAGAGEEVALVLVGESLSDAGGGGLLERARELHPHAKVALVVSPGAWADEATAKAVRDAMALGRIDYYVPTPARSRDEVFHQAISSFLLEWATERRLVPHTVHIVGEAWWGRAYELREVFERCSVPHAFWLAGSDEGRELLAKADPGAKLPLMVLPDGRALSDPSDAEIAEAAGAPRDLEEHAYDVAIVGAGPAGLSAAVYAASEGMRTLVVDEGGIGGQARSSSLIRNYLGFPRGVSGSRLAEQAYEQASVFGANFVLLHGASSLSRSADRLHISLSDGRRVNARAVILASGANYRRLGVPSLEALNGAGVFYGGPAGEAQAFSGKHAWRELGRSGRVAPCPLRASSNACRPGRLTGGRNVALSGARGQGHVQCGSPDRDHGGRRRRGGPSAGAGAARERQWRRADSAGRRVVRADWSPSPYPLAV